MCDVSTADVGRLAVGQDQAVSAREGGLAKGGTPSGGRPGMPGGDLVGPQNGEIYPTDFPQPVRAGGGWSNGKRRESSMICGSPSLTRWMNKAR